MISVALEGGVQRPVEEERDKGRELEAAEGDEAFIDHQANDKDLVNLKEIKNK